MGERFFGPPEQTLASINARQLPESPWRYTDDTQMALSIVELLEEDGCIEPDRLAFLFAERYEPMRGYGSAAHKLMRAYALGASWREMAPTLFGGKGSFGNGAAMRIAPLGGFFAEDTGKLVENAILAARVTHTHPEGIAGAVAVAMGAAAAWRQGPGTDPDRFFETVIEHTPEGMTERGIRQAAIIPADLPVEDVAATLGSGRNISAQDTVPFVMWCAAHKLANYRDALWTTLQGLGDMDTTCAMVGGIVSLACREIPDDWLTYREGLPAGFW